MTPEPRIVRGAREVSRSTVSWVLVVLIGWVLASDSVSGAPVVWAPAEFQPLTSAPWERKGATTAEVIEEIYREPDVGIRRIFLAEYLRKIPVTEIGKALDLAIPFEEQPPNDLIKFVLTVWVGRDPLGCWKRVQRLFLLAGVEEGWLNYDGWTRRLSVQDRGAIESAGYWISSRALEDFPMALERSKLPEHERVAVLKEFADRWFTVFKVWPTRTEPWQDVPVISTNHILHTDVSWIRGSFAASPDQSSRGAPGSRDLPDLALRRWLVLQPDEARAVLAAASALVPAEPEAPTKTSLALYFLWNKLDPAAFRVWASEPEADVRARAMLMSSVEQTLRDKWRADARSKEGVKEGYDLLSNWAKWDPKAALDVAAASGDPDLVDEVLDAAVYRVWDYGPANASRYAFNALQAWSDLPLRDSLPWIQILERWGEVDIGQAARSAWGLNLHYETVPKREFLRFLSGSNLFPDDGGIVDRALCSLRVWAAVQPSAMRRWIAKRPDSKERRALTWLVEHPWGKGESAR